ncbi:Fe3+-hydroxamate ABC transporter permease FhuB [Psittacicella melopsittaci]|uniref:Fe3+-hydroxamate ABC transporter permease FhuB n=1 Tax=Psittacicella melopsittaci TaxID=2028576 RepID=A0A3A1Y611_9GAMM|nr:Fe(3+)-hydroxamate ABC transporter permease FhuB [Psittacicella melopsittaci]RIY31627.1 Fe3+-hydroxamate ABC transporter permease FhuB [Psittacicella melopsittaci]
MVRKLNIFIFILLGASIALASILTLKQLPQVGLSELLNSQTNNVKILLWQNYTLPRIVMAILAGLGLAVATVILQQLTKNNLASDSTLAVSSGAQLAIVIATVFFPSFLIFGVSFIAFAGALAALMLVLLLSMRKNTNHIIVILSGMVVSLYLGALSAVFILIFPEETRSVVIWAAGSLIQDSWLDSRNLFLGLTLLLALVLLFAKSFNMLSLDDASAKRLGVPVLRIRIIGLIIAAFIVGLIVARVGMLGFIGLISTAIVRNLGARTFKQVLFYAAVVSALLLLVTDLLLQLVDFYYQMQIPTGAVTSIIGTPVLLYIMFTDKARTTKVSQESKGHRKQGGIKTYITLISLCLLALLLNLSFRNDFSYTIFELRIPRILLEIGAAIILAISGLVLQRISNNPLASPELLGITSGVNLGLMATLLLFSGASLTALWLGGTLGAFFVLSIVMLLSVKSGLQPEKVLMVGISITALYDAAQRIFIATNDFRAYTLLSLTSGTTYNASLDSALILLIVAIVAFIVIYLLNKIFILISLHTPMATELGLNIFKTRLFFILLVAIIVTCVTLNIGSIMFVGLIAPHAAKFLGFYKPRPQLVVSISIAILLMLVADLLAKNIIYPYEIPVGLVATILGGIYFAYLVRKI